MALSWSSSASLYNRERLSSCSLSTWPFETADGVPEKVVRTFADCVAFIGPDDDVPDRYPSLYDISVVRRNGFSDLTFSCASSSESGRSGRVSVSIHDEDESSYTVVDVENVARFVVDNASVLMSEGVWNGPYRLSRACVMQESPMVDRIRVFNTDKNGNLVEDSHRIAGEVSFCAGHNIVLSASDGGFSVSAEAGAGLGRIKCEKECADSEEPSTNIRPDDAGGVVIQGDGCVGVSTWGPDGNVIKIDGRCPACCPMDKCEKKAEELSDEADELTEEFDEIVDTGEELSELIEEENVSLRNATESDITVKLTAAVNPDMKALAGTGIYGRRAFASVNMAIRNWAPSAVMTATVRSLLLDGAAFTPVITTVDTGEEQSTTDRGPSGMTVELDPQQNGGSALFTVSFRSVSNLTSTTGKHRASAVVEFSWVNETRDGGTVAMSAVKSALAEFEYGGQ